LRGKRKLPEKKGKWLKKMRKVTTGKKKRFVGRNCRGKEENSQKARGRDTMGGKRKQTWVDTETQRWLTPA